MPFTVTHQNGMTESKYRTYTHEIGRKLYQQGARLDQLPRAPEDGAGSDWLYVWEDRAEAEKFAEELKKGTRDSKWVVRPVQGQTSIGPLRPLEIHVGRHSDGWTFALEPLIQLALRKQFPGSCRRTSVFVGTERGGELAATPGELRDLAGLVLIILTGLNGSQLQTFHSFRID